MKILPSDFAYLQQLVHQTTAMSIGDEKVYLAELRLAPLAKEFGLASLEELFREVRRCQHSPLKERVIEAMAIHETSFFRDRPTFDLLKKAVLPALRERRATQRKLTIWSAACSKGQEPYSLALLIAEHFRELLTWDLRIVASDFSRAILDQAREGVYDQIEVNRGLPAPLLVKYFEQQNLQWRIRKEIREMVQWEQINLCEAWPLRGPIDLIMMRNVLIYFDFDQRWQVFERVKRALAPDGYLVLGSSETTLHIHDGFELAHQGASAPCFQVTKSAGGKA